MLSRSRVFLIGCLVFIIGVAAASFLPADNLANEVWWFGAAIFFLVGAVGTEQCSARTNGAEAGGAEQCSARTNGVGRSPAPKIFLFAGIFFLAIWRYSLSLPDNTPDKVWHYNGKIMTVYGFVADEPDIREKNQKLEIAAEAISVRGLSLVVSGKILATTDLYPEYGYGDSLEITCEPEQPEKFNGFAYDRYLARYNIYSVCYYPKIKKIGSGQGNILYEKIFAFKKILAGLIDAGLSEPESSLARPIVFGGQRGLEQKIRDDFQKAGLTHIMAVSGFNISILAAIMMAALLAFGLSRRRAFYLAVIILAVYIVLVGAPASAMRAGLMGFLVLWALKLGRLNKMTNSLVLTAALLLIINPKLLRDDVGFQLSFLAIAGLVYVYPLFDAIWEKITKAVAGRVGAGRVPSLLQGAVSALLITLAAQVFTLPVLAYNFSRISLIAPLANLAVLWCIPILTICILAAIPLSYAFSSLSLIFFLPSLILTKYILIAVEFFANLPHSYLEISYLPFSWVVFYYSLVIYIIIKIRRSKLLSSEIDGSI